MKPRRYSHLHGTKEQRVILQAGLDNTILHNRVHFEVEKDRGLEGWKVGGLAKNRKQKGFKDSRIWKRKGSRIRGVEGSSGSLGIFFQNQKRQGVRKARVG
jgi:hypothetical protein